MAIQTAMTGEVPYAVFEAMSDSPETAKEQYQVFEARRKLNQDVEERAGCL